MTQSLPLAHDATAPAAARAFVCGIAAGLPGDVVRLAALLTSEVVTNAVRHGEPDVTISVDLRTRGLRVSVHDHGTAASVLAAPSDVLAPGGRGLPILEALATSWGVSSSEPLLGKDVWFTIDPTTGHGED